MRVNAALGVVGIFFIRAPSGFILEHIERVLLHLSKNAPQVHLQKREVTQAVWNIVIFDTYYINVVKRINYFYFGNSC